MAAEYGDKALDTVFMQECCPRVLEAMDRMEEWVKMLPVTGKL